jgi:glycine/D-amino acid oxidase-like deaminating enzyme
MAITDVTVRGAGVFGLSIAWACVQRGARVQVIDPYGVGAGSSGGLVGALAPHVPENWNQKKAFQFESLMLAQKIWTEIEQITGVSTGYGRTGRLQPIADAAALELARARSNSAADLWQGKAHWRVIGAAQVGDWAPHSPTDFFIHDTLTARAAPRRVGAALAAALATKGVEILPDATDAGQVVWATGASGLRQLSHDMNKTVGTGIKGQSALLEYDAGANAPQIFAGAVHVIPHTDGTVAIGSTTERDYVKGDTTDHQLDAVIERAIAVMPQLASAPIIERWAGERPRAKTRAPMLGAYPNRAGHFIANGGFKIGFGMAPKIAEVMADLLLEGRDLVPDDFRVEASL